MESSAFPAPGAADTLGFPLGVLFGLLLEVADDDGASVGLLVEPGVGLLEHAARPATANTASKGRTNRMRMESPRLHPFYVALLVLASRTPPRLWAWLGSCADGFLLGGGDQSGHGLVEFSNFFAGELQALADLARNGGGLLAKGGTFVCQLDRQ